MYYIYIVPQALNCSMGHDITCQISRYATPQDLCLIKSLTPIYKFSDFLTNI